MPTRAIGVVLAVATMDPTSTGGLRMTASGYYRVPSNVDLFFNRWQHVSAPPFNFLDDGKLPAANTHTIGSRASRNASRSPRAWRSPVWPSARAARS